ncbi:GFA family protein [Pseudomonas sp. N040]|uniref:GFA family protein n=1 Tax=Pseudomonas sp. N040 TaxID=2785325 RepID=UPI0018A3023A|nr:GFA family protein [Pseudomonas sp. N040]MBF7731170.1 GFA family protein [Pseudomonas sp. N040]MBW7014813.1 GFA family protein [Pseudomonas sp. N040]
MHVTGACLCGAVTFSAEVDESRVLICHCTDCQIQASAPFRIGALVQRDTFKMEGKIHEYCKIGTSGARRMQVFCPVCATSIYSYTPDSPAPVLSMRLGGVHQLRQLTPVHQIWGSSALPWLGKLNEIPCSMQQGIIADALKQPDAR